MAIRALYTLDAACLTPGDIIFTRNKRSAASWGIRLSTGSPYSHAALCVDHQTYIDSDMHGVHTNDLQGLVFAKKSDVAVKRLKERLPKRTMLSICDYARAEVGKLYSIPAALGSVQGFRRAKPETSNRQFCSRLVSMAYSSVEVDLVRNPMFSSPGRLFRSSKLILVPDVYRTATPDEADLKFNIPVEILRQKEYATNSFFSEIRRITKTDISTFEGLIHLVSEKPKADDVVNDFLNQPGVIFLLMVLREEFPVWFDGVDFAELLPKQTDQKSADAMYSSVVNALDRRRKKVVSLEEALSLSPRKSIAFLLDFEKLLYVSEIKRMEVLESRMRSNAP